MITFNKFLTGIIIYNILWMNFQNQNNKKTDTELLTKCALHNFIAIVAFYV